MVTKTQKRLIAAAGLATAGLAVWLRCGPLPAGLLDPDERPSTVVVDRHGEVLSEQRSALGTRSDRVDADRLPHPLAEATLAAEDIRFYSHWGVDPIAMTRAAWRDVRAMRLAEGGSTITQQVAKMLVARQHGGRAERTWATKITLAVIALRLEHRLTKSEILALYLNLAPYGNQIEGAARASHAYFGRDASTLTPAEAAFLAALPQQPTRYNPWRDPAGARPRQRRVLATMAARGLAQRRGARGRARRAARAVTRVDAASRAAFRRARARAIRRRPARGASRRRSTPDSSASSKASSACIGRTCADHHARQRRGGGARQPHGRLARVGRIRRLLRSRDTAARSTASSRRASRDRR